MAASEAVRYTLLYLKQITSKDPLHSTGTLLIVMCRLDGRGVWGSMDMCMYMAESLCCPPGKYFQSEYSIILYHICKK